MKWFYWVSYHFLSPLKMHICQSFSRMCKDKLRKTVMQVVEICSSDPSVFLTLMLCGCVHGSQFHKACSSWRAKAKLHISPSNMSNQNTPELQPIWMKSSLVCSRTLICYREPLAFKCKVRKETPAFTNFHQLKNLRSFEFWSGSSNPDWLLHATRDLQKMFTSFIELECQHG